MKIVADYFDIYLENATSLKQNRELVTVRYLTMYFARQYTRDTPEQIGRYFPGRDGKKKDRTTVLHGIKTAINLMETDNKYRIQVLEIDQKLRDIIDPPVNEECFYENDLYMKASKVNWMPPMKQEFKPVVYQNKYGNVPVESAEFRGYSLHARR